MGSNKNPAAGRTPAQPHGGRGPTPWRKDTRQKKPPAGHKPPEGVSAYAPSGTPTHTARLRAGRRLHRSAPRCKGYCHIDRPTRKPWGFTPTTDSEICLAGAVLSRGHLALSGFPSAGALWDELVAAAKRIRVVLQSLGLVGDLRRSSARR
jgi:hypothetical protein